MAIVGVDWESLPAGTDTGIKFGTENAVAITYGTDKFVVVGVDGLASYSSNGIDWTSLPAGVGTGIKFDTQRANGIAYGAGKFVVVGDDGWASYSSDGISWTILPEGTDTGIRFGIVPGFGENANSVVYGSDKFVVVGAGGKASYSSDGINWTVLPAGADTGIKFGTGLAAYANGVAYGAGKFVVVGANGMASYSSDGITWTVLPPGDATGIKFGTTQARDVFYDAGKFIVVGAGGKASYSSDGITWTILPAGEFAAGIKFSTVSGYANSVAYGSDKFVVVGLYGQASYSSDGITWTSLRPIGADIGIKFDSSSIYSVAYGADTFVAVGQDGKASYSASDSGPGPGPGPGSGSGVFVGSIVNRPPPEPATDPSVFNCRALCRVMIGTLEYEFAATINEQGEESIEYSPGVDSTDSDIDEAMFIGLVEDAYNGADINYDRYAVHISGNYWQDFKNNQFELYRDQEGQDIIVDEVPADVIDWVIGAINRFAGAPTSGVGDGEEGESEAGPIPISFGGYGDTEPVAIFFSPDGTKFYTSGTGAFGGGETSAAAIQYWTLSTPWDIRTATFNQRWIPGAPRTIGFYYSPDGTDYYVYFDNGSGSGLFYHFGTFGGQEWEIDSGSGAPSDFLDVNLTWLQEFPESMHTPLTNHVGNITFKPDGTKFYITSSTNPDSIFEIPLATPWTLSSFVEANIKELVQGNDGTDTNGLTGLAFNSDGTKLYITAQDVKEIWQYNLSTAWDITSATKNSVIDTGTVVPSSLWLYGTRLWAIDSVSGYVFQYDLS